MTADERRLLFIELASRLPYGVIIKVQENTGHEFDSYITSVSLNSIETNPINEADSGPNVFYRIDCCKPYLRSLSSMTEEERDEYWKFTTEHGYASDLNDIFDLPNYPALDWLLKKHFDYKGLIKKGLALEAPNGMYHG